MKSNYRKPILLIHKILGLITGLIVLIEAITGCLWVFKDEIESLYEPQFIIEGTDKSVIPLSKARAVGQSIFPKQSIHGILFHQHSEPIEIIFYDPEPEFYQSVFLHPHTAEVLQVKDHFSGFFAFVLEGHVRLWMPASFGEQVVGTGILMFIFIIISGLLLWIPKKRKLLKQRLKFQWKPNINWRRKNFDLHTVVGFYISVFALLFALSGSIMAYSWFKHSVYKLAGGDKSIEFIIPKSASVQLSDQNTVSENKIDNLMPKLRNQFPHATAYEVHLPQNDEQSIYVEIFNTEGVYYNSDYRFYDQNTLQQLYTGSVYGAYEEAGFSEKIVRMNYDIHVGAIGGFAGKLIAFFASLIVASLPITGFLLWYGKAYKKKQSKRKVT